MRNKITIREQSAIRLQIYLDGKVSPSDLYRIAYPGSLDAVDALADLPATASRWWRSRKVQDFYISEKAVMDARKDAERKRIESDTIARMQSLSEGSHMDGNVDYSIPANQIKKLNTLINSATDPSEALDALKVMISKLGELAPEATTQVQKPRFYLPMSCNECILHKMAGEVLGMQSSQLYGTHGKAWRENADRRLREGGRELIEKYWDRLTKKNNN